MKEIHHKFNERAIYHYCVLMLVATLLTLFILNTSCLAMKIIPRYMQQALNSRNTEGPLVSFIDLQKRDQTGAFKDINILFQKGQLDTIIEKARAVISTTPDAGLAYEILASALFMQGLDSEAIEALKKAAVIEPNQSGVYAKMGIISMKNEQLEDAQKFLKKALELNNENRIAHQYLGLIAEYQEDKPTAILHFQEGLQGTPSTYLGVAVDLGRLLNEQQRYSETIKVLEPRLPITSSVFEGHLVLALAYYRAHQFDQAKLRFERVVELNSGLPEALLGVAMSSRESGDSSAALKILKKLLQEKPDWRPAIMEYAETLLTVNQLEKAKVQFAKGVEKGSDAVAVQKRIAQYYIQQKDYPAAEKIYRQLIDTKKADDKVFVQLSEIQLAQGNYASGLATLRQGLKRFPQNGYLHFRLGGYLAALQKYDESLPEFKSALEKEPNNPMILHTYCLAQAKAGKNNAALETAQQMYDLFPQDISASILLATRLMAVGQQKKAEGVYRKALTIDSSNIIVLNNLADLLGEKGEFFEAEKLARKLNELTKNESGISLDTLGWILYRQGRFPEATEILITAISKSPDSPVIHFHLGMALAASGNNNDARKELQHAISIGKNDKWLSDAKKTLEDLLNNSAPILR